MTDMNRVSPVGAGMNDGFQAARMTQRISVAVADSPTGPWQRSEKPFLGLYAILSDHAAFTGIKQALCLFRSEDGIAWKPSAQTLVSDRTVRWADGSSETLEDLERPQMVFDDQGEPMILFCAATRRSRALGKTFNIQIPLQKGLDAKKLSE